MKYSLLLLRNVIRYVLLLTTVVWCTAATVLRGLSRQEAA